MSVIFDEVVGTVESPTDAPAREMREPGTESDAENGLQQIERQINREKWLQERLKAD